MTTGTTGMRVGPLTDDTVILQRSIYEALVRVTSAAEDFDDEDSTRTALPARQLHDAVVNLRAVVWNELRASLGLDP